MKKPIAILLAALLGCTLTADACTGLSLRAADGAVIAARTVEWGLSDAMHEKIAVFPRNKAFVGQTPEGLNGFKWTGRHGFISLTAYGQPYGPDGLNEKGLYVGMYYFPGFASYATYDKAQAARSLSVGDFMQWMLSSFTTVKEVRATLQSVRVVNVDDPRFGGAALPFHWKIADASGESIIIELVDGGKVNVHDAFLGVVTNSPAYDWHLTNLRNYLQLSPAPNQPINVARLQLGPLGAGSGMIGLPGDFTPPSRFVRAAAMTATARPLANDRDAVFEAFRILDGFNIPLGSITPADKLPKDIEGATQITSAADLKNVRYYFHTLRNREVRMIDLKAIDFARVKEQVLDGDEARHHPVRELRPRS